MNKKKGPWIIEIIWMKNSLKCKGSVKKKRRWKKIKRKKMVKRKINNAKYMKIIQMADHNVWSCTVIVIIPRSTLIKG